MKIIVVGGGDCFEELNKKCLEINQKVGKKLLIMTGPRIDINKFVSAGEIFIGVSRAALEAMSAEKPVIIAGNEGYLGVFGKDKLDKGIETNFCCRGLQMSDSENLEKDIVNLINDENKKNLGIYNREVVLKYYSVKKMTDDCELAYQEVLKKK